MKAISKGKVSELADRDARYDSDAYDAGLRAVLAGLKGGKAMLKLSGYGYRPLGGTNWVASDGSEISGRTLAGMIHRFGGGTGLDALLFGNPDDVREEMLIPLVDQREFETGSCRGDW